MILAFLAIGSSCTHAERIIEINNYNSSAFSKTGKAEFTQQLKKMEYLIEAIEKCGLTASDMYIPVSKNFY